MTRIPIRLNDECTMALQALARQEHRDIRQQAVWIIEKELERCGFLPVTMVSRHALNSSETRNGATHVTATSSK